MPAAAISTNFLQFWYNFFLYLLFSQLLTKFCYFLTVLPPEGAPAANFFM